MDTHLPIEYTPFVVWIIYFAYIFFPSKLVFNPLLIRMVQCYNQAKQSSGKFLGHIQMWNFFKYMSSVVTSSMSFLASINSDYFKIPFIVSSIISTSYSYYWDLVII